MLVRLFADNYGVFRNGFNLSLEATDLSTDRDRGYFEIPIHGEKQPLKLLRLVAIYGPNGSGKSTIIGAAHGLLNLIVRSGPKLQEGEKIPAYDPFRFDSKTSGKPCTLGCEVVVNNVVMEYSITFTDRQVIAEHVIEHHGDDARVWLKRNAQGDIIVYDNVLPGEMTINLTDVTRQNAAAISIAAQLKQKPLMSLFEALHTSLATLITDGTGLASLGYSLKMLNEDKHFHDWALRRLLMPADLGITNVSTEERPLLPDEAEQLSKVLDEDQQSRMLSRIVAVFSHQGVDGQYDLDFARESSGTQKLLSLAGPWYDVVQKQLTVFVDELSASLHPALLMALLEAFNSSPTHPKSQLVFTVHDPSPLEDVLRRDQVYFTEKNNEGVATLFALSDFGERSNNNLRKRYLEGRYGALPRLPDFDPLFDRPAN
jgi:ABC-type transport system involved in cytochrome c biogenesis ATPase subunit